MFQTLDEQRAFGNRLLTGLLWALAAIITGVALVMKQPWLGFAAASAGIAGAATAADRLLAEGGTVRMTLGAALMAQVSLLVACQSGHAWQIDMHMAYFAALAALVIYCDWQVILAAAAVVAVHHLTLSFILPAAVFPGSGRLGRVLVHAVILICEAASLMWVCQNITGMFARSEQAVRRAQEAQQVAEGAMAAADAARAAETRAAEERAALQETVDAERHVVVESLATGLERLAGGDLAYRLTTRFAPQFEKLRGDYNDAMGRLEATISSIAASTRGMHASVRELSSAAGNLSRRTEQQAANLEETAAAISEITDMVGGAAQGAKQAASVVSTARNDARKSSDVVASAVAAMSEIEASSEQIGQIIGVIDEIAFQTNLLALNAGVEAARAGDAGKGFAVVASEVRALAQRSAEAAKEIKTLISSSTDQVATGVALVGQTGDALNRIVSQVAQLDELIVTIAASAQDQSNSIRQVNSAVTRMDQATQQNAAMVEESTAASHALAKEAESLAGAVAQFKVGQAAAGVARAA